MVIIRKNLQMNKQKIIPPRPTIDTLIHSLHHHTPDKPEPGSYAVSKNPFEQINASEELNSGQNILDYDSGPDSEQEDALYETQWGDADQEFPDVQSLDQEMEYEDILQRAGVYTGEEILKYSIGKVTKLRDLYIHQIHQLRQIYIEKKRQYVHDLKKEKELYCSIHSQKKTSLEELKKYKQLKAMISYGRKHGLDAILSKREHEKRNSISMKHPSKSQKISKCYHLDDGVRCFSSCVPLTKYCLRHILMDKRQVLFRACGAPFNNTTCTNPVLCIYPGETCVFHSTFKPDDDETEIKSGGDNEEIEEKEMKEEMVEVKKDDDEENVTIDVE